MRRFSSDNLDSSIESATRVTSYYDHNLRKTFSLDNEQSLQDYFNKQLKTNYISKKTTTNIIFLLQKRVYSSVVE